jgi:hypothetical protein
MRTVVDNTLVVDVVAELNRIGYVWQPTNNEDYICGKCAFHQDTTPSCYFHLEKQYFSCKACNASGSIAKHIARFLQQPTELVELELRKRYKVTAADKPVEVSLVEKYHSQIWNYPHLLAELAKRGVTPELIRQYRIGSDDKGVIKIPVHNGKGTWVNIISYRPGAPEKKFTNMVGRGQPRIYPMEQLQYNRLMLCGGPLKAAVAAAELNAYGIGCVASTGGEQFANWPKGFITQQLEHLFVCLDIDKAGKTASEALAQAYHPRADFCGILTLPLDPDKYPKGDISDYCGPAVGGKLAPLLAQVQRYEPAEIFEPEQEPEKVSLRTACHAVSANKRVEVRALVNSKEIDAFFLPKQVAVVCDRQQDFCGTCPILNLVNGSNVRIPAESETLLQMVNAPSKLHRDLIRKSLRIPPCKSVEFTPTEQYHVSQVRLTNDLDSGTGWEEESAAMEAIAIDLELELNETYDLVGRIVPHPNTQRATAIFSGASTVVDSLAEYEVDPEVLQKFQPEDWSIYALGKKVKEIYNDIESHVTNIYERIDLHILYDLCFHSVLYYRYANTLQKGNVEVLVVGDSAEGKSQVIERLIKHYGLGQKVNMENASVAGLLGGVNEANKRRYISWGILPANDRRLVFLDELKDSPPEIMGKLTDLRSSGKAEIPKIERGAARARVRLPVSSNGRQSLKAMQYAYGVDMIREVVPNLEDIRRFDACMVVSEQDVTAEARQRVPVENCGHGVYDSESCRAAVLWGWTRSPEQVEFEDWNHLTEKINELTKKFSPETPILDSGTSLHKLARLSAALAVRTFSHGDTPETILVRRCHVDFVAMYLNHIYTAKAFGYDRYSEAINKQNQLENVDAIIDRIIRLPYPQQFAERLLQTNAIELRDICDWTGFDRLEAAAIVSLLVRTNAIKRDGPTRYRKSMAFIAMLQRLINDGSFNNTPPDYGSREI